MRGNFFSRIMLLLLFQAIVAMGLAQPILVKGRVLQPDNQPLAAATVTVKGTNKATLTDQNGQFSINVPSATSVLIISYMGMETQELAVNAGEAMQVSMVAAKAANMEEVVVVGYGTQRKSLVTGAISKVKSADLENVPNTRIEQSLQGRVSGVTILQNSGQPGSTSTIRVRGITTLGGGNNPLWVVDGIVVDQGGIGYLNQSDIESIEVLKDAASAAIYGTRAATGVILVTTKKGKSGKLTVAYNGSYGISSPARKLELLNATEYATLINERSVAAGGGILFPNPESYGKGTDWQDVIFNNSAKRNSQEISVSGGGDRSTFYMSFGLLDQEGIVSTDISQYNRKSFRLNSTHKLSKVFTLGQTLGYARQKSIGLGNTNSEFGGPLSSAINLDPITPLVVTDPAIANAPPYSSNPVFRDANGNPYGISSMVGQEMTNPLAYQQTRLGNYSWSDDLVGNLYLEAKILHGLTFRSTVGGKLAYWGNQNFTPVFYLNPTNQATQNSYGKGDNNVFNWNIENVLTYNKLVGSHNFTLLLGQGAYVENIGGGSSVTLYNLPITSHEDASFNFDIPQANRNSSSYDATEHKLTSLFARLNYTYADKYLFTGIVRRDGSSRFGSNNKFGVFPSFSAGWVASKENFWPQNNVVTSLKIRAGYGIVGNDALPDFRYLSTVTGGYNYALGTSGNVTTGYAPRTLDNPDLRWEETSQGNIGFDAQLFQNFSLGADFYQKKTSGILRPVNIPGYVGVAELPYANIADMQNTGVDVELGYRKKIGQVGFSANGNLSYVKNEVTYVAADANYIAGEASFQSMGAVTRTQVGQSYNAFWGYQSLGIFQNQDEIAAYANKAGAPIQPKAAPGDFKWQDTNGDGKITVDDKVFLGTSLPKFTYGLTINLDYKGFDFMVFGQGAAGNKIFQGLRRLDVANANYSKKALGRWTGEGTSNDIPRLINSDPNGNITNMSDYYLEDGDYFRIKLLQLGYTLPNKWFTKLGVTRFRAYVTGENLLTLTNYTGYDPEVGGGVYGIDKGQYPQAKSVIFGLQLQF